LTIDATDTQNEAGKIHQSGSELQPTLELKYELAELRHAKLLQLLARGLNQSEAAEALGVDKSTVSRDIQLIRDSAQQEIKDYIEVELPFVHKKTLSAFDEVLRQAWSIVDSYDKSDSKIMLQALRLIADVLVIRQQVYSNVQYITQAISLIAAMKGKLVA